MSLQFESLPLCEVTIRLATKTHLVLELDQLCKITAAFSDKYPKAALIDSPQPSPGRQSINIFVGRPVGARFGSNDGLEIILQPELLAISWKQRTDRDKYPHFEKLKSELKWAAETIAETTGGPLKFNAINMAYVDLVPCESQPTSEFVASYFAEGLLPTRLLGDGAFHESVASWREADSQVDLRLHLRALRALGGKGSGFSLTTVAGRRVTVCDWPADALELIHEKLEMMFPDLLSQKAKNEWGFKDDATH